MYLIPLVSTLLSSIISGSMVARFIGHRGCAITSVILLFSAFLSSLAIWYEVTLAGCEVFISLFGTWFSVGSFNVDWSVYIDLYTAHMFLTVTSVSCAVHYYALVYMRADPHLNLFMSYLSLFTFFMLVLVSSDNLLMMLVGWEGYKHHSLNGIISLQNIYVAWFFSKKPANSRLGPHSPLFKQIITGALLGDGWLESRRLGTRLGISFKNEYKDVANWYQLFFYGLGYHNEIQINEPLSRIHKNTKKTGVYYQLRTFSFQTLNRYYDQWYKTQSGNKYRKTVPQDVGNYLTPLALALWIMGDGSGMRDGSFKLSSHGFTKPENEFLAYILLEKYNIKATVHRDRTYYHLYIWKESIPRLKALTSPFMLPSCEYKWRHVKQSSYRIFKSN